MTVLLIAPARLAPGVGDALEGAPVAAYEDLQGLLAALAAHSGPAVLWGDGIAPAWEEQVAAAIRAHGQPVIEVRSDCWDGQSPSPISAACRGVVSGFGRNGVLRAVRLLSS